MSETVSLYAVTGVIQTIRDQKVMLDSDLARIYGVPTKVLNQAVKRNRERFPADFMFQISAEEAEASRSRSRVAGVEKNGNRSQSVTGSQKHRDPRFRPFAFTEHGATGYFRSPTSPKSRRNRGLPNTFIIIAESTDHGKSRSKYCR